MGEPNFPTIESADHKLKNEINLKLALLLRKGIHLTDIVDLLDAKEFLSYMQTKKGQAPVAHFSVDNFVKKRISENRKISLPDDYTKLDEVILPPSEMEITTGSGNGFKEAGVIPRSALLMETLAELGLKYSVVEGENDPKMMRKLSYLIFILPSIEKLVLVNNEEGNATFIVHKAKQEEWRDYMNKTKEELSAMPHDIVSVVKYPDKNKEGHREIWKNKIKDLLVEEIGCSVDAPEGWITPVKLATLLGLNSGSIEAIVRKYKKSNPDWLKRYATMRGDVAIHYSPELVEMIKKKLNERELVPLVPDGWLNLAAFSLKAGIAPQTLRAYVESYRQDYPQWFGNYRNHLNQQVEHLHPDLVDTVYREVKKTELAPAGWLTKNAFAQKSGITFDAIQNKVEKYRIDHPEWIKTFRGTMGRRSEHLHPDLIKIIQEEDASLVLVPDGWMTTNQLADSVGVTFRTIQRYINKYESEHPEWLFVYKNHRGKPLEYLSPELVEKIRNEYHGTSIAPAEWSSVYTLAQKWNTTVQTLHDQSEKQRILNPEWTKIHRNSHGKNLEYYSPELIKMLAKRHEKKEFAPDGWEMGFSLAKKIGISPETLRNHAEEYRAGNPEWFKYYEHRMGKQFEYFSPELSEILFNKYGKLGVAPEGWMIARGLGISLGVDRTTVKNYAEEFRPNHPEWFSKFRHPKSLEMEYYHPELVKKIKDYFTEIMSVPDGWLVAFSVAKLTGVTSPTIQKNAEIFRSEHPEWFRKYRDNAGHVSEHYSPELVEILKEKMQKGQ